MRIAALLLLFAGLSLHAQTDSVYYGRPDTSPPPKKKEPLSSRPWVKKITYGGNFQAWFGNPTFIFLSPTVGYSPVNNFNIGIGGIYNYSRIDFGPYGKYSQSIFGTHTYARYTIASSYFFQVQYDRLRQPDLLASMAGEKIWVDYLMVGGGVRQSVGGKAGLMMTLMYNLTPHPLSIYPSRVILQLGFVAGF
jgi:hypothetical protein